MAVRSGPARSQFATSEPASRLSNPFVGILFDYFSFRSRLPLVV